MWFHYFVGRNRYSVNLDAVAWVEYPAATPDGTVTVPNATLHMRDGAKLTVPRERADDLRKRLLLGED